MGWATRPALLYLPWRGSDQPGKDKGQDAALHVNDGGAGEINVSVADAEIGAQGASQPPPQTQLPKMG